MDRLNEIARRIMTEKLEESVTTLTELAGLGSVNRIFEVTTDSDLYVLRINLELNKRVEYQKEDWCLNKVAQLGIPSPTVIRNDVWRDMPYMIQKKIEGSHGEQCDVEEKQLIWRALGKYARKYQRIEHIEHREVEESEFHKNWKSRLHYNIDQLHNEDSLLTQKRLTNEQHQYAKEVLSELKEREFQVGLVHGDLCPRNVIWNQSQVYLLDWGTAEINVIPHIEIGLVRMSGEASETEFDHFLEGMGLSLTDYEEMKEDIFRLNLLHILDKYRWAESYDKENLSHYVDKIIDQLNRTNG